MNNTNLLIIDSRILNIEQIKAAIQIPKVKYILLDYYNDTFITLNNKIESLGIKKIESIGLLRHGYILPTYKLLDKQKTGSILKNVETEDNLLNSWSEIRNFLLSLKFTYSLKNFDFLSCRLDKDSNYQFVFNRLETTLNINIRASSDDLGNIANGGNWVLESDNVNIQDIYFNDKILNYPYLFFMTTVTIKAISFTKPYDGVYFNEPLITSDLPVLGTLSGSISYSGTYTTALNVGTYTIIPSGLSSTEYYINFENGILSIIPTELSVSVNDYIKVYDGTNIFNDYVINYSGLIDSDSESVLSGSLTLSGSFLNAVNVGTYTIMPSGLFSNNYHITYDKTYLKIIPASLLVIANNVGKIYDRYPYTDFNSVFYDGFVNTESETTSDLLGSLEYSGSFIGATNAGTYIIQPGGLTSTNYDIMFINGILTIYYDDFLVAANNFRKFYDNLFFTNPTLSYFHSVWDVSGYLIYSGSYETAKNIGSYTILVNPTLNTNNYVISYFNGTLIIDKAEVKIKALPVTKIYDAIPYTDIPVTWEGLLGTDTSDIFIGQLLNIGTSYQTVNIGTYNIIPSGVDTQNYTIIYDESILTINKAPLVLNTQFYSKVYDGNNIGYGDVIASISGIINNENIRVSSYDVRFHTNQAGYQFIDICNITLSGFTINNYYIVPVPAIIGLIEPRLLTAWYTSKFKGYNGTTEPNGLVGTLSGILGNDYVTISSSIAKFRQASIGFHFIDISSATLWGTDANNYIVRTVTPIIGRIIQNNLIINWYGGHKIYDNNNNAKFTLTYSISGIIEEDNLTISGFTAIYKSRDTGEWFIDISNVVYSSMYLDAYVFPAMKPVPGLIRPKTIYPYFVGGDKIYDSEIFTGPVVYTLSGIIGTQDVDISNWYPVYESPNAGYNIINFPQIRLTGFNSYNYIIYNQISIIGLITAKTLVATFYGGNKIYDSYTTASLSWSLSGMIGQEIVAISSFDANFKSPNVGTWYVDVSNISLQNINYVTVYEPFTRTISKREIVATFFNGDKTYDNNFDTGPITYSLSGMVNQETLSISSYYSRYKKKTVGYNLIDISAVIITDDNYYVKAIPPFISYINYRYITPVISRGQKVYDKTNFTGPINIDLSNIALGDFLTISTYISRFKDVNSGIQLIDVSNLKLVGPTVTNYKIVPIVPFSSEIYPKRIFLRVIGGDKTYDGTLVLGRVSRITLSGAYDGDSISLLNTWTGNFSSPNVGANNIDISNIDLSGANVLNYVGTYVPFTRFILSKLLTITFSNGNKIYDSYADTGLLSYDISGIIENEFIDISSYDSQYRNRNAGFRMIDINNVQLYGATSQNYTVRPVTSISGIIYKKDLAITFEGGDKIYNGTLVPGSLAWSLSGQVAQERISLTSFDSAFSNSNVGYNLINFSNLVLSSTNYTAVALSIYANIYYKNLDITFSGGSKIYDSTRYVGPSITGLISGIENNESITISTYIAFFSTSNVGLNRIDVSNVIIQGNSVGNYLINPIVPHYSNITKLKLVASFSNGDKNYDGTRETPTLDYSLSGLIGSEIIALTNWNSKFKSANVGYQFIDISNISFNGFTASNYFLESVKMLTAYISSIPIVATFNGGDKIYNSTVVTGPLTFTTSGMVNNEIITVGNFTSRYANSNAGRQRIDISNVILSGLFGASATNYYVIPVRPIMGTISKKDITAIFSGGTKVYDSTRFTGPSINGTLSGIISSEIITISTYIAFFSTASVGRQRIDVSNLIITGPTAPNYYLNPIIPHYSNIDKLNLVASFYNGDKDYDGTRETPILDYSLSGIIGSEIIIISSWTSKFKSSRVGYQFIDISNVSLQGTTSLNYNLEPVKMLTAYISPIPLVTTFIGGDKIYDGTLVTGPVIGTISGMVNNERINIRDFTSNYVNRNAGNQRIDISNVILSGAFGVNVTNYYLVPVRPIMSLISKKDITATFSGGIKVYDSTRFTSPLTGTLTGIIGLELITISTYIAFFSTQNVGTQRIDVSNLIITGVTAPNYYLNPIIPHYSNITKKNFNATFYDGNKNYDGTIETPILNYSLSGIIGSEVIIISSWNSKFKSANIGNQFIDISNISFNGFTASNYFLEPVKMLTAFISSIPIIVSFNGGDKIYDSTVVPSALTFTTSGMVNNEIVTVNNFIARYANSNAGRQRIDISNVILSGLFGASATNYYIIPIRPITGTISKKDITATFSGGTKIYDSTRFTGPLTGTISGIISSELITISTFISFFSTQNVGLNRVDVSNLIITGVTALNYYLNPIAPHYSTINQKQLIASFNGGDKTYDGTLVPGILSNTLSGIIGSEIISISSFVSKYRTSQIGNQIIDVSNVILIGSTVNNYFIRSILPITGLINPRYITGNFNGGTKIYDGTQIPGSLAWSLNNIVSGEFIDISSYNAVFSSQNIGLRRIDISNVILKGVTSNNYIILPIDSIYALINKKQLTVTFNGGDKIYDGTNVPSQLIWEVSNNIDNEVITVNSFNSLYLDRNVGVHRIDISNVILSGTTVLNYDLQPIQSIYKTISKRTLIFNFFGGNKIYDRNTVVENYSWNFDNIVSGETISASFLPYYNNFNSGFQQITISNIIITNNNYNIQQLKSISGFINRRNLDIIQDYLIKNYDATQAFSQSNGFKVVNSILEDNINLIYYVARFKNINVGYSLVDISDIILNGNTSNYILNSTPSLSGYIIPKPFNVYFNSKNKIYDGKTEITDLSYSINGTFSRDNITLINYNAMFSTPDVGIRRIDISGLVFSGSIFNYILNNVISVSGSITQKGLDFLFSGGDKIFDGTVAPGNSLTYTVSGIISNAPVSVLYYDAKFNSPIAGLQRIDISNLSINNTNYFINPVRSINANIFKQAINLQFIGGNKIYDGTTNVTNLNIIIDNPSVSLLYYTASFLNPNVGLNYITVTNYILTSIDLNNYNVITNTTISAFIFSKPITINFTGGAKKYDSTLNTGPLVSSINGLVAGQNIFVQSYNSYFRNKSIGFQQIDISNIVLSSATNYIISSYSANNALISKADLSGILTADDKYYDGTTDVVNPLITLQNIYGFDNVVVNSFISTFVSPLYGLQQINTTNIVLGGLDANNYNIIVDPIYRNILSQSLTITFTGGSKIYDTTLNTGPLNFTITGANPSDNITILIYTSTFVSPNVGLQQINITNIVLGGANTLNYNYTVEPIYAEISPKPLDLLYFNKNKIYDGTQNLTNIYLQTNENITVSSFIGSYKSFNVGNTFIDISNVILTNYNYTIKPIQSQSAIINKRPVTVIFYNGNKTYDGTTNFLGTDYYFQNVISSDTDISLVSYVGTFNNPNVGINLVTISNIVFNNNNYESGFVPTISASIIPKVVSTNFKAYTRIYNNKTDVTLYNPIINGLISSDANNTISISDWIANYTDKYVGNNKNINIINIRFIGSSSLNYILNNQIQTASGTIIQSPVTVVIKSASKIYDKTTSTGLLSYTISGVYTEDLSGIIFNYTNSTFLNPLTENNKQILLSGITISGNLAYNYNLVSYIATGDITKKPINIKFTGQNKIYDNTISAIVFNPIIYGLYNDDNVSVNDYKSNFINSGVGINKLINIRNIILTGTDSFNYSANDSSANASIIYPTKINLNIVNNTWTYKDISNTAIINWDPLWIQDYITNIIDIANNTNNINDNIIITSDGKILNANSVQDTNLPLNRIRNNAISSNNQLLTTTNNWSSYSITSYPNNIVSFSNNFVISTNQIYKSGNLIYTDFSSNFVDLEALDSSNIFVITNNKFILTSNNGGISFTKQQITDVNDNFTAINMFNVFNGYIVGENGLILRTNDGRLWSKLNSLTNQRLNCIYNINSNDVIIGGNNGIILTSSNRGISWSILTSGTNENILNIYATSFFDIKVVCSNSLLLTYISSPQGNLKLYDNQTLLFDTNVNLNTSQVVYNFTNFPVKKYWLNALFTPNLVNSYSSATTPIRIQNIRPIYYYDSYLTDILFSSGFIGPTPIVDQSGGTFSLIGNNLISINNTGNIIFSDLIPVGRYSFITIYTLATVSSQQTHQLIVRPNITYPDSNIQIIYGSGLVLPSPITSPDGGIFTISDFIGNLARTNKCTISLSGIVNILSTTEIGNYGLGITYNVNNIVNSARLNVSILSNFGYIPNITNLDYLSGGKSELPFYDPSGGIFSLQDISSTIVAQNKVTVNSKGQLTFTNTIDVGFYYLRVIYRGNFFVYSVNSSPFFKYILQQDFKEIQYVSSIVDASANASVIPTGGSFSCSNLINLVELNSSTGKLIYNPGIDVSSYFFNIKYEYNKGYKFIVHNLVVKPYINYYINALILPFDISGSSIIPEINPNGGTFSLLELDNILVQLNNASINQNGQIIFTNRIPVGIYNFNVSYMYNSLITLFSYQLRVIPTINYNINTLTITYDNSGNSILPSVKPANGIYTISSIIQLSKININSTTGRLSFNKEIPVGNYNININYVNNNLSNSTNYLLNVIPNIFYRNNSSIINYKTSSRSERPYINPIAGTFSSGIIDSSGTSIIDSSGTSIIDSSGTLIFSNNLNVGNYNLLVNYTFNNNTNSTLYYLTVRPNISLLQSLYESYYDTSNNIRVIDPIVDQSGGIISVYDISGSLVSSNYVTQNIIYTSANIPVNMYRVGVLYQLNNTFNSTYYDVIIRPRFYYINSTIYTLYKNSVNSELPYVIPSNGNYSIEDVSNNTTIFSNGQINFGPNIYVGSYYYKVNYFINQIISSSFVNLIVLPVINYNINSLTILYDTSGLSIAPYVNPSNGTFSGSNITINSNGVISFDKSYNYNVGTNIITVNYSVNNITNSTIYRLNVLPVIYYINNTSIVDYLSVNNSSAPYYQQKGGLFEIADYIGSLVNTNQVSIDNSGIILFNNLDSSNNNNNLDSSNNNNSNNVIDVGIYSFIIKYTLQNLSNTTIYNLTVKPIVYYTNNILAINYETFGNSDLPIALQQGGLFGITDISGSLVFNNIVTIDTSGIIYCTNQLDVGLYTLNVSYTLNNLTANTYFFVKILPVIRYPSLNRVLNYGTAGISTIPIANPSKGFYSVEQVALINSGTGQLTFTNTIDVGRYSIPVFYTYNGITTSINFNLTINPILIYTSGITSLLYNHEISYSEQPVYLQKGGVFEISNNLFDIDNSGIIMFDKFINVGKYYFDIKYTLADVFVIYTYLLNVIPNIDLNYNYIELDYTNVFSDYVIPYVDQSGGTFTFEDLSGSLINYLDVNYTNGTFNLSNTVDVNLYTIKIIYSYNNTSNFALFTLNIKPIYFYSTDNFTTIYNSNKYSIQPYVNQAGGKFSIITNYNGLLIDASNGILNFGYDLEIGDYSLILKYALRNTFSTTNYFLKVLPIIDYGYPYFISEYNTTTYTPEAIYDPVGGTFTIQGAEDASANIIINNLIATNAISINSGNGLVTFNSSIPVGLYLLQVNYNYGNTFNSTEISYTMKPYLLYNPSSNRVPYHDISFSVMPTFAPSNGIFTASVPRINLIYTGISIDKNNGIIRFGLINAGFWTITIKYTVNGVSNTVTYTLQILANVYYNPPYSVIAFNSVASTAAPIAKVLGGVYTLQEQTTGITINSNTGILTFSYLTTGVYYIPIVYTVFGSPVVINYTVLVKPIVIYNPDSVNAFYTNPTISTIPSFNPPNGKFSATFNDINNSRLLSTIQIDASSGVISSTEDLRVGAYNLNVSYLSNSSEEIIPYTINIYPILAYSQGSIITTYGSDYFTEKPFVNPKRGVFTSLDPQFYVDGSAGIIEIKNTNNVGKYIVPVQYKYNNMSVYSNYNIIINPLLDYISTNKEMLYGYQDRSIEPIAKQSLGTFYINSISGTFNIPIQTVYSLEQNTFNNFGVVLNGYSGLLNFGSNIKVGKYKFNIKYAINDLSSNQIYDLTVYPNIYYTLSSLVLDYNTTGLTTRPFVDQSGGYFTIGNITDYRNEASKININNLTGLINFYKGVSVGLYNFNIKYELNKIVNYTKYNLNVRPNYYYLNDTLEVVYGSIGYSDSPFVLTTGGKFYIEDYGLLDEYTLSVNENTGIININLVSINNYNIKLKYILSGSVTFTNFTIIVKPYINYAIGSINIDYGLPDYSEIPFGLEKFGNYSFNNIDELDFQKSKVTIDASNGQIYFGDYINVGSYNLSIKYTVNQIYNTFNYVLNVKPFLSYTVSGIIINHNIFTEKYTFDLPTVVPTKGLFYFNDSSNSFIQSNISLDRFTGEINLYNRIPPNDYNLFINYYLKNVVNQYYIKLQVYPNYSFTDITIYYDISNIITAIPYIDPSGGTFEIIQPMDINLYSKVNINTNGSLNIQSDIKVGTWNLGLLYSKIKSSDINVNINVKPTVRYSKNYLNLLNGNTGETEIPYISPFGGIFELENVNGNAITIDSKLGIVSVGILDIDVYNFNIKYTYDNVTSLIPFSVYVLFLFKYDISGSLINYNYSGFSQQPNIDIYNGIFSIPNSFKNIGINIDSSNGILSFSNNIQVSNYIIPVTYNVSDLFKTNNYILIVQPYISYDISSIEINYLTSYKSKYPIVNPKFGLFNINLENSIIDNSGQFIIPGLNIGYYNLMINYTYNSVSNRLIIPVVSKPIFYYNNNNISTIYNNIFYSDAPTISPFFGRFILNTTDTIDTSNNTNNQNTNNTNINENTGIIQFDSQLPINRYVYNIGYKTNNITTYLNYYVKQVPYFKYNNEITNIIAGTFSQSNIPSALPYGGVYSINNSNNNILLDTLNNNILLDTISGIVYFSNNFDIETVNVDVNYSFGDISSNYRLVKNMIPSIYYPTQIFDYGIINTSISPNKNRDYGKFYLKFEPQTYIQTEKISIDSSSGIIRLDNGLDVGKNFFYVGYYKNKLETLFTYNFIIRPIISYSNVNVIQTETTILTPELKPNPGTIGNIYLLSQYDFISLVSSKTGQLSIRTAPIGFYNINILYTYSDVSSNFNFNIIVNPEFYYNSDVEIIYGNTGDSDAPYVSQSGGVFNITQVINGLQFNTNTGIFSFGEGIEVGEYQVIVYYIINTITVQTIFNFIVIPFINYDNFYTVEYGTEGESPQPIIIPSGGTFQLLTEVDGITVDETLGVIYTTNILTVNTYELTIGYTYNNVQGSGILFVYVIPKILLLNITAIDKIYDGTSSVKVKSNKLSGIINNDKVFIKNTYDAYFISPDVDYFIPIYLSNLELDGPEQNNYIIEDSGTAYGNILYVSYMPSSVRINQGTIGRSNTPLISESFDSPSFLIKNPIDGITINPYGIINWNNTLNIGIYNLKILVYNIDNSFELDFTLEVTTNLYNAEFPIIPPNVENISFESVKYNLRYNNSEGRSYVIETSQPALLAKIEINAYNNTSLTHDLIEYKTFYFNLPNSDASDSLIISELNDDGTVNPKYVYNLKWVTGKQWQVTLRYLSDFNIQNNNILINNPPTFNLPSGTYFSVLQIVITALPTSIIYYTLDGSQPTIDSIKYIGPITVSNTTTIKAFAITSGYLDSSASSVTYDLNYIPCILSNTLIKTPDGYEFIDNLKIGDLVVNSLGQEVPIKNILKYYIDKPKERELPIIVPKNFFAPNIPDKDTYITENHAILTKNNKWLLGFDNLNLFRKLDTKPLYYNIELPDYFNDHLIVNNMPIESWCARKYKYIYKNRTQEIINNKKVIVVNKIKI